MRCVRLCWFSLIVFFTAFASLWYNFVKEEATTTTTTTSIVDHCESSVHSLYDIPCSTSALEVRVCRNLYRDGASGLQLGSSWGDVDHTAWRQFDCNTLAAQRVAFKSRVQSNNLREVLTTMQTQREKEINIAKSMASSPSCRVTIVVARFKEDVSWLCKLLHNPIFCLIVYTKQGGLTTFPRCLTHSNQTQHVHLTHNLADEASAYLDFILTHYHTPNRMSLFVAFIHGHEKGWHAQTSMVHILEQLHYGVYPFVDLNFDQLFCVPFPSNVLSTRLRQNGSSRFEHANLEYVGNTRKKRLYEGWMIAKHIVPEQLWTQDLCHVRSAQFVVSRERILAQPYSRYEKLVRYIHDNERPGKGSGAFEYIWHIVFGEPLHVTTISKEFLFNA
jgi:hypothetical protein